MYFTFSEIMIVIYSSKKLAGKKIEKVKIDMIPKTNEDYLSVTYACIRFIDTIQFLLSS